ncbi:SCO family protein [Loktanella sp. M215]|uniref:SCO family protein n=1 Tax=Loktanella sp. M215 TaxID=2675431 RepID=UPI001F47E5AE|nr:SCO family protein [Loktanella sp. M215]
MNTLTRRAALAALTAAASTPALANHPGENLDARMMEMEQYFQIIDAAAPPFALQDADGKPVSLSDFDDKIVVLNFIYASCPDVCPLHSEKIAAIQASINDGPMKDRVQFITITTDPVNDTPDILRDYADLHGLDTSNWVILTKTPDQPDDATRRLAKDYGLEFTMTAEMGTMVHGAVTHVIDTGGRLAGKFHGMEFSKVNLILYVSELISNGQHRQRESGWWDRVSGIFQ